MVVVASADEDVDESRHSVCVVTHHHRDRNSLSAAKPAEVQSDDERSGLKLSGRTFLVEERS